MAPARRPGLTLVELVIVLVILVALAGLVMPLLSGTTQDAKATVTRATLQDLAASLGRYRADNAGQLPAPGSVGMGPPGNRPNHLQLRYLFVNPATESNAATYDPFSKLGWNGPYLLCGCGRYAGNAAAGFTAAYGSDGDPNPIDGWGHPVVLVPFVDAGGVAHAWLQSAGTNGVLEVPAGLTAPPQPQSNGEGSAFPTSAGATAVDDVTFVIF